MKNKQVLLLGNGLNRGFEKASWKELICQVQDKYQCKYTYKQIEHLPFSMQIVAASDDHVDKAMRFLSEKMITDEICDDQRKLLNQYLALPFDTFLTTNYSFEIEQALGCPAKPGKYRNAVHYIKKCTPREKQFGLYKRFVVNEKAIWHIHGDFLAPNSIIMGQYYYGKALREYQNYLMWFMRRYYADPNNFVPYSWLDYFMTCDVHIVGLGMDSAEMDLWWLLNCKKRNMPDTNVYYYEPSFEDDSKRSIMLTSYGVTIKKIQAEEKDYMGFYSAVPQIIKLNIANGEV